MHLNCFVQVSSLREVKFNSSSGGCVAPLVPSPRQEAWYQGVKGCALPCEDPHFDRQRMAGFHSFVGIMASLSVACTAFTVVSSGGLEWCYVPEHIFALYVMG